MFEEKEVPQPANWEEHPHLHLLKGFLLLMIFVIYILCKIFGRSSKEISCMDGSPYKLTKVLPISDPLKFPVQSVQGPLKEHTYMPEFENLHHPGCKFYSKVD